MSVKRPKRPIEKVRSGEGTIKRPKKALPSFADGNHALDGGMLAGTLMRVDGVEVYALCDEGGNYTPVYHVEIKGRMYELELRPIADAKYPAAGGPPSHRTAKDIKTGKTEAPDVVAPHGVLSHHLIDQYVLADEPVAKIVGRFLKTIPVGWEVFSMNVVHVPSLGTVEIEYERRSLLDPTLGVRGERWSITEGALL